MGTHNLRFEQKYGKYQNFLSENFHFLVVKFSVYLNRLVFVMLQDLLRFLREEPARIPQQAIRKPVYSSKNRGRECRRKWFHTIEHD